MVSLTDFHDHESENRSSSMNATKGILITMLICADNKPMTLQVNEQGRRFS